MVQRLKADPIKDEMSGIRRLVASEVFQLLCLVERIRSTEEGRRKLTAIAEACDAVDKVMSDLDRMTRRQYEMLSATLCSALDAELGSNSFFAQLIVKKESRKSYIPSHSAATLDDGMEDEQWDKLWVNDVPQALDKTGFKFEHLGELRQGIGHLHIVQAANNYSRLLGKAKELMDLELVNEVNQALVEEGLCSAEQSDDLKDVARVDAVKSKALDSYYRNVINLLDDVKRLTGIATVTREQVPEVRSEVEEHTWQHRHTKKEKQIDVLTLRIPFDELDRAMKNGLSSHVFADIISAVSKKFGEGGNGMVSNSDAVRIANTRRVSSWALLQPTIFDILPLPILHRGCLLANWRYEKSCDGAGYKSTLKAAEAFFEKSSEHGTANTLKQSYEKVKGVYKAPNSSKVNSSLVDLYIRQVDSRSAFPIAELRLVFQPLNAGFEAAMNMLAERISDLEFKRRAGFSWKPIYPQFSGDKTLKAMRQLVEFLCAENKPTGDTERKFDEFVVDFGPDFEGFDSLKELAKSVRPLVG